MFFSRKDSFLFPYTKEEVYSNFDNKQEVPWSIAQYNIPFIHHFIYGTGPCSYISIRNRP